MDLTAAVSLDGFRRVAGEYLDKKDHYVIVNYLRNGIGQEWGGHISPLAAYDADTDRFLILDVLQKSEYALFHVTIAISHSFFFCLSSSFSRKFSNLSHSF
jgi:hypothetical protein